MISHEETDKKFDEIVQPPKGYYMDSMMVSLVEKIRAFIHSRELLAYKRGIEDAKEVLPEQKYQKHEFKVGVPNCIHCNEPRILRETNRTVVRRDEKTGGQVVDVTEKSYDQTDFPCLKNPTPGFNEGIREARAALEALLP